jgi:hypothetical protein
VAGRFWPPRRLRLLGAALAAAGAVGLAALIGHDLAAWLPAAAPGDRQYAFRRALVVWAEQTDLPALQLVLAGAVCALAGRRRGASGPR